MKPSRIGDAAREGLWSRVKRVALTDVGALVRGMNAADLEALERTLLEADFGVAATVELTRVVEDGVRRGHLKTEHQLREAMEEAIVGLLTGPAHPERLARGEGQGPTVILLIGVNGVGKTTTVAKLAAQLQRERHETLLAATDTYRAGAVAQLEAWAERLGVPCVTGAPGGDPAAVAFDAIAAAEARGIDTVLIDTAGRLHTQDDLMNELQKLTRVVARRRPGAPHEVLLVLDGTVGQNAVQQGKLFARAVPPTGIIVTKLDGTARGGAVIALRRELQVPIRFLGTGEQLTDLEPFDARRFAGRLLEGG